MLKALIIIVKFGRLNYYTSPRIKHVASAEAQLFEKKKMRDRTLNAPSM